MIKVEAESFRLAEVFTISRGSRTEAKVLTVRVEREGVTGWGECVPYARYGETLESVAAEIAGLPEGIDRRALQQALPAGAARNAVDCALWDLEAKSAGRHAAELAGLAPLKPAITTFTISLGEPRKMHADAAKASHRDLLKVKLGGDGDHERIIAVREGAPGARLILDANEAWTEDLLEPLLAVAASVDAQIVEQPLPAGRDQRLADVERPVPICADESLHTREELAEMRARYDCLNIKLDKTGGLTEALALQREARALGFSIMCGCMVGSSLAMAPAMLIAQDAEFVDLDGPLLLAEDRKPAIGFSGSLILPPPRALWG
ncbi:MAG: dipeptide epimerase [Rhodobacteraceae bacterium]|nr:dipeptide epimerase [Paracoccaceae bacterium]